MCRVERRSVWGQQSQGMRDTVEMRSERAGRGPRVGTQIAKFIIGPHKALQISQQRRDIPWLML